MRTDSNTKASIVGRQVKNTRRYGKKETDGAADEKSGYSRRRLLLLLLLLGHAIRMWRTN